MLIVVSTLVSALFLGWLAWVIVDKSDPPARVELVAWEVIDDQSVWIRVDARFRDDQVAGTCTFGSTAENRSPSGDLTISFAEIRAALARKEAGQDDKFVLRTIERATSVEKKSCTED